MEMAGAALFNIAGSIMRKLNSESLQEIWWPWSLKSEIENFKQLVLRIRSRLLDAEEKSSSDSRIRYWLDDFKAVFYEAEMLSEDLSTEALRRRVLTGDKIGKKVRLFFSHSNQLTYGLVMAPKIKFLRNRLEMLAAALEEFHIVERSTETPVRARSRKQTISSFSGREDDKIAIIKFLMDSNFDMDVSVISILGMGGLGKTTLAQHVYNDEKVKTHFELKLWVYVSDVFDVKLIVANMLESMTGEDCSHLEMDTLINLLHEKINGKKYLVVLDDVCIEDRKKWLDLILSMIGGARGSKILITTRSRNVGLVTRSTIMYELRSLSNEESWSLFKQIAFEPGYVPNPRQEAIGKEILKMCMGVPLSIQAIASLLYSKNVESEWLSFKDEELSKVNIREQYVMPTLKLSYDLLPSPLKNCFAYCRLFPKDYELDVETLILLWMGQGYIKSSDPSQCLEDIGLEYFMDLLQRSFFQEVKRDALDSIKSCRMNNLMHDLAASVAGFGSNRINSNTINMDEKTYHMSLGFHLNSTWQTPVGLFQAKQLRTFLLPSQEVWLSNEDGRWKMPNLEAIFSNFRQLRVFDLHNSGIEEVPTSIDKLKHLRYLDVSKNDRIKALPDSITKLKNLQVLKLSDCEELKELPKDIKKLVNLRHLDLERCWNLRHMPRGLGQLSSLQSLTWFVVANHNSVSNHIGSLKELDALHNLRGRIEIRNLKHVKTGLSEFEVANLRKKQHLQSLSLCWNRDDDDCVHVDYDEKSLQSLQPHQNLKKFKVCDYGGVRFPNWLSSLTNLVDIWIQDCGRCELLPQLHHIQSLKYLRIQGFPNLKYIDHEGDHFLNGEGRREESNFFLSLKELYLLDCPNLEGWWKKMGNLDPAMKNIAGLSHFPSLCKLEIRDCPKLTCMPIFPKLDEKLLLENASLEPFQQTIKMVMGAAASTSSTPGHSLFMLKVLWIVSIEDLETLPKELLQKLTSLQELHLMDCPRLASLPLEMYSLISLRELDIINCAKLKERYGSSKCSDWQKISHIRNIRIDGQKIQWEGSYLLDHKDSSTVTASPLSKLRTITVEDLEYLPEEWLQNLTCLEELYIVSCPKLMSLPPGMRHLTSLQLLDISQCPRLKERCGNKKCLDWRNISHIPKIQIDGQRIQWDRCYLLLDE
ncbi:hypothetical protein JCGZ_16860 [Jatropha curcas]|uniref:NB-ARC domain-containing protein n=1 Tax=Jatropha curcas TaxID=180498 RepID=A0A067L8J4_JATCU|nr:putative disease resistance protein RGA1 [Jatropha curcas]XP_020532843.1 putative disease resistance protein RGA1 [Jatropha curcas]XP_020532844.1 putative disease resistance protein RGA1 [Jatropha curcas]XP_020532845.1 putative disease resistance protein RGA1 [Jatropha curcas]XP_020532847.1 putative disease resistance protein RGA1 [Jatropha curcas]XP_037494157.1 putative disease resistance protein RGA1 [Jatropha curcas]XP_037494158.1 putative disease resistance protein RGA1 [Jatropha curca